jgi:hypothetical protein
MNEERRHGSGDRRSQSGHDPMVDRQAGYSTDAALTLAPDLTVLYATEGYLRLTMRTREELVGKKVFDALPPNPIAPDAMELMWKSVQEAIRTRKPQVMPVVRYDLVRPGVLGGGYEVRYWKATNTPRYTQNGTLSHVIHVPEDVTQEQINVNLARGNFLAERRVMIVLVLAAFLFSAGFALTGREERRINGLARGVCLRQVDALHATQALRPIVAQALLVKRNTPGLRNTERYFLKITAGKNFTPVNCKR